MAVNLYIRREANSPEAALVASAAAGAPPIPFPTFTVRDNVAVNIYLVDGAGGYDDISGDAAYTVRIGIGKPGASPTEGAYTLTCDGDETTSLSPTLSAAALQSALNDLSSVTTAGGVTVSGTAPNYVITWNETGTQEDFTADASGLVPLSLVKIENKTDGSAGQKIVWITLAEELLTEQSEFTTGGDYWTGRIHLFTAKASEQLAGLEHGTFTAFVTVIDSSSRPDTTYQSDCIVLQTLNTSDPSSNFTPGPSGFTETDPVFGASPAATITSTQITNWDLAFNWGNHALAGYASIQYVKQNFEETIPAGLASQVLDGTKNWISKTDWDTAYTHSQETGNAHNTTIDEIIAPGTDYQVLMSYNGEWMVGTITEEGGTPGGTVTQVNTSSPLTGGPITSSGTIGITRADSTHSGYLHVDDWNDFDQKLDTGHVAEAYNPDTGLRCKIYYTRANGPIEFYAGPEF